MRYAVMQVRDTPTSTFSFCSFGRETLKLRFINYIVLFYKLFIMRDLFSSMTYKQIVNILNVFGTSHERKAINNYVIDVVWFDYDEEIDCFEVSLGSEDFGPRNESFDWTLPANGESESFSVEV